MPSFPLDPDTQAGAPFTAMLLRQSLVTMELEQKRSFLTLAETPDEMQTAAEAYEASNVVRPHGPLVRLQSRSATDWPTVCKGLLSRGNTVFRRDYDRRASIVVLLRVTTHCLEATMQLAGLAPLTALTPIPTSDSVDSMGLREGFIRTSLQKRMPYLPKLDIPSLTRDLENSRRDALTASRADRLRLFERADRLNGYFGPVQQLLAGITQTHHKPSRRIRGIDQADEDARQAVVEGVQHVETITRAFRNAINWSVADGHLRSAEQRLGQQYETRVRGQVLAELTDSVFDILNSGDDTMFATAGESQRELAQIITIGLREHASELVPISSRDLGNTR